MDNASGQRRGDRRIGGSRNGDADQCPTARAQPSSAKPTISVPGEREVVTNVLGDDLGRDIASA